MTNQPDHEAPIEAEGDPVSEVERLNARLAEAEAKAKESFDSYLRAVAEADNVRKRAQRDVESAVRGVQKIAEGLQRLFRRPSAAKSESAASAPEGE